MFKKKKYSLKEYHDLGKKLKERLELETEIVSMKFIKSVSEIPNGFIRPLKDLGKKMTICMAMSDARREGKNTAITADDNPCTPVSFAHGWVKGVSIWAFLKSQEENQWQKNAFATLRGISKLSKLGGFMAQYPLNRMLGHKGVIVAPLSNTPFIPDTVLIYGYPEQITHVAHSLSFEGKYVPKAVLTGYGDSCFNAGLIPLKSKKPIFVLLGSGDRSLGRVEKYEVAMGMPGSMIFYVNDNLFKSGGENNFKHQLENPIPLDQIDESMLPGWTNVRNLIKN